MLSKKEVLEVMTRNGGWCTGVICGNCPFYSEEYCYAPYIESSKDAQRELDKLNKKGRM